MALDEFPGKKRLITGQELKEGGIEATLAAEREQWKADVRRAVTQMYRGHKFTVADLQKGVGREPHHPNCWGAMMNHLARAHLCAGTGRYVMQTRPSCHAAVIQVWERL